MEKSGIIVKTVLFLLLTGLSLQALEFSPVKQLEEAVSEYNKGDYQKALVLFERLNENTDSPGLYFNIGNCHFKAGKIGPALSAYYSAYRRDPLNPDIRHNLKFVRNLAKDQLPDEDTLSGLKDVFLNLVRHFSLKTHEYLFFSIYFVLVLMCIFAGIIKHSFSSYKIPLITLALLLVLSAAGLWTRYNGLKLPGGVVSVEEASVRYGPSLTDTEAFILHEGAKFDIYNRINGWSQLKLGDGKSGWISNDKFVIIK